MSLFGTVVGLPKDRLAISLIEKGEVVTYAVNGVKLPLPLISNDLVSPKVAKFLLDKITPWLGDCKAKVVFQQNPDQVHIVVSYKADDKEVSQPWSAGLLAITYNFGGDTALEQYVRTEVNNILNVYTGKF